MSKVAIMQPYLFPYLGYFQLLHDADIFVVYDDTQFIKGGWINRNFLLMNGSPSLFTFGVKSDSTYALIKDRQFSSHFEKDRDTLFKTLNTAYRKAPYYNQVIRLLESILNTEEKSVSRLIYNSLQEILNYLKLDCKLLLSSEIEQDRSLKNTDRVIHLCKRLNSNTYINATGGQQLYQKERFQSEGIKLLFLKTSNVTYSQLNYPFVPNLSILDILMFNSPEQSMWLLNQYELI